MERGGAQHKHEDPILHFNREFAADYGIVVKLREAFKEGPGLAVLIEFPLAAPGYL
jgi:hypothetical protein